MGGGGWDAEFPDEAGAIHSLAIYGEELFPSRIVWQVSDDLFAFEVVDARPRIWVALDQWIVVEVGRRHWEIPYGVEGEAEARRILLNASR